MDKTKQIASIYKILLLYEDVVDVTNSTTELEYLAYLSRLYIWACGLGIDEIVTTIKGLEIVGVTATHRNIKTVVFHMIDLLKKGDVAIGTTLL